MVSDQGVLTCVDADIQEAKSVPVTLRSFSASPTWLMARYFSSTKTNNYSVGMRVISFDCWPKITWTAGCWFSVDRARRDPFCTDTIISHRSAQKRPGRAMLRALYARSVRSSQ